jgi:hypothetical protein
LALFTALWTRFAALLLHELTAFFAVHATHLFTVLGALFGRQTRTVLALFTALWTRFAALLLHELTAFLTIHVTHLFTVFSALFGRQT